MAKIIFVSPPGSDLIPDLGEWGGTPLLKPYGYVPSQRVGFLHHFGLKEGIDFAHFGLESGMIFKDSKWILENIFFAVRLF